MVPEHPAAAALGRHRLRAGRRGGTAGPAVGAAAVLRRCHRRGGRSKPAAATAGRPGSRGPRGLRPLGQPAERARFPGDARSARGRARGGDLYEGLDRSVRGGQVPLRRFKDELTAVWFDAGGFAHVFCGEPRSDQLGGMHYRGRYLDLQEQGIAGLMSGCRVPRHRARAAGLHRRRALSACPAAAHSGPPAPRATPTTWEPATCCSPRPRPIANSDGSAMRRCAWRRSRHRSAMPTSRWWWFAATRSAPSTRTFRPPATAAGARRAAPAASRLAAGGLECGRELGACPDLHKGPGRHRDRRRHIGDSQEPVAARALRDQPVARLALKKSTVRCQASLAAASL